MVAGVNSDSAIFSHSFIQCVDTYFQENQENEMETIVCGRLTANHAYTGKYMCG